MQAPEFADDILARTQHQVVGVAQNDLRTGFFQQPDFDALHRAARSDRHERRELHDAARRFELAAPRRRFRVFFQQFVFEQRHFSLFASLALAGCRKTLAC